MRRILHHTWTLPIALTLVLTILALPILTYPMGRDQAMYGLIGRGILNGQIPYVDFWDVKPPAIYYIYAFGIGLFGSGEGAIRALDLITVPFTGLILYALAARFSSRRAGLLAMVLFFVFYFTETFSTLTQSDSIVTLPMTLAVWCVVKAGDTPRDSKLALRWAFAAGVLAAAVLWFKHYYVLFAMALVIYHIRQRRGIVLKEAGAFIAGGLIVGLGVLLYFAAIGIVDDMLTVAQSASGYSAVGTDNLLDALLNYLGFRWLHWGVLLILTLLWPIYHWRNRHAGWLMVGLWLVSGLAFVILQAKGFDTHWIPMLPPLVLLAAAGTGALLDSIANFINRRGTQTILYGLTMLGIVAILLVTMWARALPYLRGDETQAEYYAHFQGNDFKPAESLAVLHFLRDNIPPNSTLFVWGFRPEIYYLGPYVPATRFIAHFPLVGDWFPSEWRDEAVMDLAAANPPIVLVMQADYMPWVTGRNEDSHQLLVEYAGLSNWLAAGYDRDWDVELGDFLVWRRRE